jgi:type II secretory pathway component PulC
MAPLPLLVLALVVPQDLQLVGLVVSHAPDHCVAVLRSGGKTRLVSPGEPAFGGRLVAVGVRGASLEFDGQRVELGLASAAAIAAVAPAAAEPAALRPAPPDAPPVARTLERREVDRRLSLEIPRILAETAAVPVLQEGKITGLALTRIPENSLLTDAGLRPGDVLTQINDTVIDGLPTLIGLWPRLQGAQDLRAVVIRNGVPVTLSVSLK